MKTGALNGTAILLFRHLPFAHETFGMQPKIAVCPTPTTKEGHIIMLHDFCNDYLLHISLPWNKSDRSGFDRCASCQTPPAFTLQ